MSVKVGMQLLCRPAANWVHRADFAHMFEIVQVCTRNFDLLDKLTWSTAAADLTRSL